MILQLHQEALQKMWKKSDILALKLNLDIGLEKIDTNKETSF